MSDVLQSMFENPAARRILRSLSVPVPATLRRAHGPWEARPLDGRMVAVFGPSGALDPFISATLEHGGARPVAWTASSETAPMDALVFDGSGLRGPGDLTSGFSFLKATIGMLARDGRVVLLGRPPGGDATKAAAAGALEGIARSLAKEVGRRGATAHVVYVEAGAEPRLEGVLRFLLSDRSAFISGQAFTIRSGPSDGRLGFTRCLDQRVALVTGAARGIGAATAARLAQEGARVICVDRPEEARATTELAARLEGLPFLADITEPQAPKDLAAVIRERFGGLDIVVHNAGVTRDRTLAKMPLSDWTLALEVNLNAVLRMHAELEPLLRESGRVVALSSIAGIAGNFGQTNYAASKAGLIGFCRCLAPTLAGRGITVNAIAPGFIETRLTAAIPMFTREAARRLSNLAQGGQPVDVAEAITFLASPGSSGITGSVLRVCGGNFIGQ